MFSPETLKIIAKFINLKSYVAGLYAIELKKVKDSTLPDPDGNAVTVCAPSGGFEVIGMQTGNDFTIYRVIDLGLASGTAFTKTAVQATPIGFLVFGLPWFARYLMASYSLKIPM